MTFESKQNAGQGAGNSVAAGARATMGEPPPIAAPKKARRPVDLVECKAVIRELVDAEWKRVNLPSSQAFHFEKREHYTVLVFSGSPKWPQVMAIAEAMQLAKIHLKGKARLQRESKNNRGDHLDERWRIVPCHLK